MICIRASGKTGSKQPKHTEELSGAELLLSGPLLEELLTTTTRLATCETHGIFFLEKGQTTFIVFVAAFTLLTRLDSILEVKMHPHHFRLVKLLI